MKPTKFTPAWPVLVLLLLCASLARADFIQIDGFVPVLAGGTRSVVISPTSNTTTNNPGTFAEIAGQAHVTLGGNGNSAGVVTITYNFATPVDLTDGGTNTQFFLVMDKILREQAAEGQTALHVTIEVLGGGINGTYGSIGIGNVPDGQSMAINFDCNVNPTCFSPMPNFSSVSRIRVRLAFPQNYATSTDITQVVMDSVYVTPTGGSFPPVFTSGGSSATYQEGSAGSPVQFAASGVPEPVLSMTSGSLPAGVSWNSSNYTLSGTPAAGTQGSYPITINAANSSGSAGKNFTLVVQGPPTITSANSASFVENQPDNFTVTAEGDPQPAFSVTSGSLPAGITLSSGGQLSGTATSAGVSTFTITANNGINPVDNQSFTLTVLADLDADGTPDISDVDIDGDGMSNTFENNAGLDPYDPNDASGDLDGDGATNLQEYDASTDPTSDDYPPVLDEPQPVTADATGLFTQVDLNPLAATDAKDGELAATPDQLYLAPGDHQVERNATDLSGNSTSKLQSVKVRPQVSLGPDFTSAEGSSHSLKVYLNGPAAEYPVTVPYTLSGTASAGDHSLVEGNIVINAGTQASLNLSLLADAMPEGDETLQLILGDADNAISGFRSAQTVLISASNVAPLVQLGALQNGKPTRLITTDGGLVTVSATITDANPADSHSIDWSLSDQTLVDTDAEDATFSFDPALLGPGVYRLVASASDGSLTSDAALSVKLLAAAPMLGAEDSDLDGNDDASEGFSDLDLDGIPDYLDAISSTNVLQSTAPQADRFLLETEPGLTLGLGNGALAIGSDARLDAQTLLDHLQLTLPATADLEATTPTLLDLIISQLGKSGDSVDIVVPLAAPIADGDNFLSALNGKWQVITQLASAPGAEGYCPSPASADYISGLHTGNHCLRLTLVDGGKGDSDASQNGRIMLRGGLVQYRPPVSDADNDDANNPDIDLGGSLGLGMLALLLMVSCSRRR